MKEKYFKHNLSLRSSFKVSNKRLIGFFKSFTAMISNSKTIQIQSGISKRQLMPRILYFISLCNEKRKLRFDQTLSLSINC